MTTLDPHRPHPELIASFALMEAAPDAMDRFVQLAAEMTAYQQRLKSSGRLDYPLWIGVADGARITKFLIPRIAPEDRDEALFARWAAWTREYESIHAASPKWRLKEMIGAVSETHHCMSWPDRWERDVLAWALAEEDDPPCPFDDRNNVLDEAFRRELGRLARQCGGFLYRCEESLQVVFAPDEDLERIWAHQDHLAAIARSKPFGFFHDMSRPGRKDHLRDLTPLEEHVLRKIERPKGLQGWLRRIRQKLRRRG